MPRHYSLDFKKSAVLITKGGASTMSTANELNIPLKTLENWITAYNKNPNIFDPDYISPQEKIKELEKTIKQQNETIQILKKPLPSLRARINSLFYYSRIFFLFYLQHL